MKNKLISVIIAVVLFNTLLPYYSYATNTQESWMDVEKKGVKSYNSIVYQGTADVNGKSESIQEVPGLASSVVKVLVRILAFIPGAASFLMTVTVRDYVTEANNSLKWQWFTIQDLVFGKIGVFDVNFFDTTTGSNIKSNANIAIKENVRDWYYVIMRVSIILSLLVLIYIRNTNGIFNCC